MSTKTTESITAETPDKLSGKEFEEALILEAGRLETQKLMTMGRYGTMVVMVDGKWLPVPSYPDFEGVLPGGRQFIIEAKVCSQPSFRIQSDKLKHKQVRHLLERAEFGVICLLLLHFTGRVGKTFEDKPMTLAIPVTPARLGGWEVWEQYAACKDKKKEFPCLSRELAQSIGKPVRWHTPPRCATVRPDLLPVIA